MVVDTIARICGSVRPWAWQVVNRTMQLRSIFFAPSGGRYRLAETLNSHTSNSTKCKHRQGCLPAATAGLLQCRGRGFYASDTHDAQYMLLVYAVRFIYP